MPKSIVDERERGQCLGELRQTINSIQNAVRQLQELPDFTTPSSASTADWEQALAAADERRDAALRAIESDFVLSQPAKDEAATAWKKWHKSVATHVNAIVRQMGEWPQARWHWDEQVNNIVIGVDSITIADERATREVPPEAEEHATLIDAVRQALEALRAWEDEADAVRTPIEQLLRSSKEEIALIWATGRAKVDHQFDEDPRVVSWRKIMRDKIL